MKHENNQQAARECHSIAWHFMAFVVAGVFWNNLSRLIPTNPNYDAAWWKMAFAALLFAWFTILANEARMTR